MENKEDNKVLFLVDGNNHAQRLWYSSHNVFPIRAIQSIINNITRNSASFFKAFNRNIDKNTLYEIVIAFDTHNSKKVRQQICSDYKATRVTDTSIPVEFFTQLDALRHNEITFNINFDIPIKIVSNDNAEADDIIASYCKKYSNYLKIIISSDKDMYSLIDDNTIIFKYDFIHHNNIVTKNKLLHKYGQHIITKNGLNLFTIYKSMTGDGSDNIRGIYRVGHANSMKLLSYLKYDGTNIDEAASLFIENVLKHYKSEKDIYDFKTAYSLIKPIYVQV